MQKVEWVSHPDELCVYVKDSGVIRYTTAGVRKHMYFPPRRPASPTMLDQFDRQAAEYAARATSFREEYGDVVYIRWNTLPASGHSTNWATGQVEKGVSVYAARYNPALDIVEMIENGTNSGAMLGYMFDGAPAYLVTGEANGLGADGEPLLRNIKLIAEMKIEEEGLKVK